jgi:hypothetical protein
VKKARLPKVDAVTADGMRIFSVRFCPVRAASL